MKVVFKSFVLCALLFFCSMKVFQMTVSNIQQEMVYSKSIILKSVLSWVLLPIRMAISMQSS